MVNALSLSGLLRNERQPLPPDERVEQRRLPNIGPPDERELGQPVGRAVLRPHTALDELGLRHLGVPRVLAQHDVRALQNPGAQCGGGAIAGGQLRLRRDEEAVGGYLGDGGGGGEEVGIIGVFERWRRGGREGGPEEGGEGSRRRV